MEIFPPRNESKSLNKIKDCSNFKRVPKKILEQISFLEQFQSTVTLREAVLLNDLRRMPRNLFMEQMKLFHDINRLYNNRSCFYNDLIGFIETKL